MGTPSATPARTGVLGRAVIVTAAAVAALLAWAAATGAQTVVAAHPDSVRVRPGHSIEIDVLANDEGADLVISGFDETAAGLGGAITPIYADETEQEIVALRYQAPSELPVGEEGPITEGTFGYIVTDGVISDIGEVTVKIDRAPQLRDEEATLTRNVCAGRSTWLDLVTLWGTDADGDSLVIADVEPPAGAGLAVRRLGNSIEIRPAPGFETGEGNDVTFTVWLGDPAAAALGDYLPVEVHVSVSEDHCGSSS